MAIESDNFKIPAADGGAFGAYIANPEDCKDAPAIIVIQEIFGINEDMRKKCNALAEDGYIAICPDLFWRIEPGIELTHSDEKQLQRAFQLYQEFNESLGLTDLQTTLGYARNHKACNEKVGALGFCLGGKLAYMMACHTDIDVAVGYYGVAIETMLDQSGGIKNPLLLHMAEEDEFVNKEAQTQIKNALSNNPHVTIQTYPDAGHAFARDGGINYNAEATTAANKRTEEFLKKHLFTALGTQ